HEDRGKRVEQDSGSQGSMLLSGYELSIRRVRRLVRGDHRLVLVADGEQLVLRHDVLAAPLHMELVDARLDDRVDRTGLLAESAVDAFEEIDVIAGRAAGAVRAEAGLDRDRLRGAHRLAELARDAALLPVRIAAQRMQPAEPRRLRRLLLGIEHRRLAREQVLQGQTKPQQEIRQQDRLYRIHFPSLAAAGKSVSDPFFAARLLMLRRRQSKKVSDTNFPAAFPAVTPTTGRSPTPPSRPRRRSRQS